MLFSTGYLPRPPITRPADDQRPLQGEDSEGPDGAQPRHYGDGSIHLRITKLVNVMMNKTSGASKQTYISECCMYVHAYVYLV